jgi:hypothetical protein
VDPSWRPLTERRDSAPHSTEERTAALLFSYYNGKQLIDEVDVDLADLDAAKTEVVKFADEALKSEQPRTFGRELNGE